MEVQNPVCPESTIESANERRGFLKKAALITGAAVVGGTILGSRAVSKLVPESSATSGHIEYCCPTGTAIAGCTCSANGVYGGARTTGTGVRGCSSSGTGVGGGSLTGTGVCGYSIRGPGVVGKSVYCCFLEKGGCKPGVCGSSYSGPGVKGISKYCSVYDVGGCNSGVFGGSFLGPGVQGTSCSGPGVCGTSGSISQPGVFGHSINVGVRGSSLFVCFCGRHLGGSSPGVCGNSYSGPGVQGTSCSGPGVLAKAGTKTAIPLVTKGAVCQCSPLTEWQNSSGTPLSVVNKQGYFGINKTSACNPLCVSGKIAASGLGLGTTTPATTLQVNGSLGAKVATATSNYTMSALDFGVLANATSGALSVTLPAASTALGMIVFIKKVDSSTNAVTVVAAGSNLIEGESSEILSVQFASLTLISDGSSNWYMIANENIDSSYGR